MSREKHISMAMFHWIKMYPMALICLSPLSGAMTASLPHVFDESWLPVVPNPILESQVPQSASLLPTMPILAFAWLWLLQITLNPSFLQPNWREPWEPRSDFHLAAPKWCGTELLVSDRRVQGVSRLVYSDEMHSLFTRDLHAETNLWEGCLPISG